MDNITSFLLGFSVAMFLWAVYNERSGNKN